VVSHFPGANPRKRERIKRDDSTGTSGSQSRHAPWRGRLLRHPAMTACCVTLTLLAGVLAASSGSASADPPDPKAQKKKLDAQIKNQLDDLHESKSALVASDRAYDASVVKLTAVRARYAVTQGELLAARAADLVAADRLAKAEKALVDAKTDVVAGEDQITASQRGIGQAVRSSYQQQSGLLNIAIVLQGTSPTDVATGMQIQRTVFDVQSNAMERLNNAQAQLVSKRAKVAEAEQAVAVERAAAAATLSRVKALDAKVAAEKAEVTQVTLAKQKAYSDVIVQRQADLAEYAALVAERVRVTRILIARAKAEKAAAARRRAAELAAERARAQREHRRPRNIPDPSNDNALLAWPIPGAPITSPYGMRYHPILHYWKLHDGTDFGAGCGTPIHAVADGYVSDRYYNGGYGNRVFVSHGIKRGHSLISAYNHLSRYAVHTGEHVKRGEIVGYVGSTGYSTGCHLHFMIYQDGDAVNPMNWY